MMSDDDSCIVFVGTWSMLSSVSSSENGSANLREWEVYTR